MRKMFKNLYQIILDFWTFKGLCKWLTNILYHEFVSFRESNNWQIIKRFLSMLSITGTIMLIASTNRKNIMPQSMTLPSVKIRDIYSTPGSCINILKCTSVNVNFDAEFRLFKSISQIPNSSKTQINLEKKKFFHWNI